MSEGQRGDSPPTKAQRARNAQQNTMTQSITNTLKKLARSPYMLYAAIVVIGMAAYGLHLNNLGFYWDDWPWVWRAHVQGTAGLLKIDEYHRPLSGVVLYIGGLLAGENPLGWQSYALSLRLLGAASLAWLLHILWENERSRNIWVVMFFLLYPGFNQQFVSVNNSRHLFPLIPFFLSLGFMLKSQQKNTRLHSAIALALNAITMLTSEYYYGLELTRPIILWLYHYRTQKDVRASLLNAFKAWLPYALLLAALFGWRYNVSTQRNYSITILDQIKQDGLGQLIQKAALDLWTATVSAWQSVFNRSSLQEYGARMRLLYWGIVFGSGMGTLVYLSLQKKQDAETRWRLETLVIGASALGISLLPFWVTNLDPKLGFPDDRLLLPAALGTSLLLAALIDILIRPSALKLLVVALLVGFAAGSHNQNALIYQAAWTSTSSFFEQLSTRAPSLPAKTTILSNQLPGRSTDNSLIAALNWVYAPNFTDGNIPYQILYVDLRFGRDNPEIDEDLIRSNYYLAYPFEGSAEQVLGVFYEPPACLQILYPENSLRQIPAPLDAAIPYSHPEIILDETGMTAALPSFFADTGTQRWCNYFQRAELARQRGDWARVVQLGDAAFAAGKSPHHPSERIPFIEGYAQISAWAQAAQLTLDAPKRSSMFCGVWERLQNATPSSPEKDSAFEKVEQRFECGFQEKTQR